MHLSERRIRITSHTISGAVLLGLDGEIDLGNAASFGSLLRDCAAQTPPPRLIVLDLTDVAFLSAAGVRALYGFAEECAGRGVDTRLVVERNGIVDRVTRLAELDRYVPVYTALSEALEADARPAR